MKTKILVLYTSTGMGIKATGVNIAEQLRKSPDYEVLARDVEEVESSAAITATRTVYLTVLDKISWLWGFLYSSDVVMFFALPLRKFIFSFKSRNVLKILREFQPAIVVSTQTMPSGIIAYLKAKGLYQGKLVIMFSDYHLHPFWLYDEADLYICNIPEQVEELKTLGINESKIKLTGTLIAEKFYKQISREDACLKTGLLVSMPVILLGGAGRARSSMKEIFLQLLRSQRSFQVVVVCGKNEQLKQELLAITAPDKHPVKILGYINNIDVLMSAASVLVYKTGGPSMAEAVVKKLPMVLTDVRPGHELVNLEYLLRNNIVQYGRIPREVVFLVEQFLDRKLPNTSEASFTRIVKPPGNVSVLEAINSFALKPQAPKVRIYQESPI